MKATRRALLLASLAASATPVAAPMAAQAAVDDPWRRAAQIRARIRAPRIPGRTVPITRYGAVGDGRVDCAGAIRTAISVAHMSGGGRVVIPRGTWKTGALHLLSNVELHLEHGATLAFDTNPAAYLPLVLTRFEGVECMNYSPLIYAYNQENIAVTGSGVIDGGATNENWWSWKGRRTAGWTDGMPHQADDRTRLFEMGEQGVAVADRVFGAGHFLRTSFIQPYRCRNVLIEGVHLRGSPMWQIHPVLSENVIVRGLTIDGGGGPNTDGCDPESCRDVLIEDCTFNTGDDCIAIKAGRNGDGRRLATPSENILIRNCRMQDGHGALTVGSEISGGVRNVFAENCRMSSPHLDHAIRFKNNFMRGGVLEHFYFRNITVGEVAHAVLTVDFHYEEGANGGHAPVLRDVQIERLASGASPHAIDAQGLPGATIADISLRDCAFAGVSGDNIVDHVDNLHFENVRINGQLVQNA